MNPDVPPSSRSFPPLSALIGRRRGSPGLPAAALLALAPAALLGSCTVGGSGNASVLGGVESLVFAKRAVRTADGSDDVGAGDQTIDYRRYVPGGGVFLLSPATPGGTLTELTESFEGVDVNGLDLSFDGEAVVFAMRHADDDYYHLWYARLDGTVLRQLTFGDYDDVKPIFIPGDRIAFLTAQPYTDMGTRADEYEHRREVSQLATIGVDTGDADRRVCSQNLSHTGDLFPMSDGRIGYSRWEHLGPVNDVKLFAVNPDCTNMVAVAGQHGKPANSLVHMREVETGVYVGIATSRRGTIQAGSLVRVDARAPEGAALGFDEQEATYELLTPQVPRDEASPATGVGRYRRPHPLPGDDDRLLVSWADGDVNERNELAGTAPGFGIYLFDPARGRRELVYDDPATWDVYPIPVAPREVPPVRPATVDGAIDYRTPAVLGSVDITVTSLNETVRGGSLDGASLADALEASHRVRIIEGFSSEIGALREFGLTLHEGAAILAEVPVQADGSWEARVNPYLPYHLQPLDEFGLSIRNQMTWIQAMPGESRRCGGCHERRSEVVVPRSGPTTLAQQIGPVDAMKPVAERIEIPWFGAAPESRGTNPHANLQDLFDARCVQCHDGSAGEEDPTPDPFAGRSYAVTVPAEDGSMASPETLRIPYLRLTDEVIAAYFEEEVVSYPVSYVSLLFPSSMMDDVEISGSLPPEWVVPGEARRSRLVEKVNALSERPECQGPGAPAADCWAWSAPAHPEDVGVSLTREERMMIVRMADLGGQYWSRRNVDGANVWREAGYDD
jgi:hypothetical protein